MRAAFPLLGLLLVASCGYRAGPLETRGGARTVAVPAFRSTTLRRGLERDLTRAVREEILARSDLRLVDESEAPDLVITGTLDNVGERVLSERDRGELRESSVTVAARVTVTDTRSGTPVVDGARFSEFEPIVPAKGISIRTAENAAIRTLAERIVSSLSAGW